MKSTVTILFLLLYGLALIRPALPLIDYYIQLEEYKARCQNKARPELHCNGQCILMQKLKAVNIGIEDPFSPPAPAKVNLDDYPIGFIAISEIPMFAFSAKETDSAFAISLSYLSPHISDVFHPPII